MRYLFSLLKLSAARSRAGRRRFTHTLKEKEMAAEKAWANSRDAFLLDQMKNKPGRATVAELVESASLDKILAKYLPAPPPALKRDLVAWRHSSN